MIYLFSEIQMENSQANYWVRSFFLTTVACLGLDSDCKKK